MGKSEILHATAPCRQVTEVQCEAAMSGAEMFPAKGCTIGASA